MFSNFKNAFSDKEREVIIPSAVIESLSETLPEGFSYEPVEGKEILQLCADSMKINIPITIANEKREIKPENLSEYLYRSQREIKGKLDVDGKIKINGHNFSINEIIVFPFDNISMKERETEFLIKPPQFPGPFPLAIEGNDVKRILNIQRQPYEHMHKSLYKSVDKGVLNIEYIIDEKERSFKCNLNINIKDAKDVEEVVEASKIYDAFINKKVMLGGIEVGQNSHFIGDKEFISTLKFWERVYEVEQATKKKFDVNVIITEKEGMWIERLYRCLVEGRPYKEIIHTDMMTITMAEDVNEEELLGGNISFQIIVPQEITLFKQKVECYLVVIVLDVRISDIKKVDKGVYELKINQDKPEGVQEVVKCFLDEEEAKLYVNSITDYRKEIEEATKISVEDY